jgi:hypothetical protein
MPSPVPFTVQFNPEAIRIALQIPRDLLEDRTPLNSGALNRRAMLEKAEHFAEAFRLVMLGMKAPDNTAAFEQLRNEVADHGLWVKAQIEALDAADAEQK